MPANMLSYSEVFLVPILLVVCPVDAVPPIFYYLWLQDYIRTVLDNENPTWRDNVATVRVKIPIENRMPGREAHLRFVGNYPCRVFDWGQVGRILHELRNSFWSNDVSDLSKEDITQARHVLKGALELKGVFGDLTSAGEKPKKNQSLLLELLRRTCFFAEDRTQSKTSEA
jgi:hypothetical protein